jgi:small subunit ribosomal protein S6
MLSNYEITFIVEPNYDDERINGVVGKFTEFIKNNGGDVGRIDRMGKKRLAYSIGKRQYGYYVYTEVKMPGAAVSPLNRWFQLSEDIFRHLVVFMSERDIKFKQITQEIYKKEMEQRNASTRPTRAPRPGGTNGRRGDESMSTEE